MTGIGDYGAGNLRSVTNAVHALGIEPRLIAKPADLAGVDRPVTARRGCCWRA